MAVQTCGTCKGTKTVDGEGWEELWVWMCGDCVSGEQRADEPCEADTDVELFDVVLAAEASVRGEMASAILGVDPATQARGVKNVARARAELSRLIDGMDVNQLRAYGEYRKANRPVQG